MKSQCVVSLRGQCVVADVLARPADYLAPPKTRQRLEDVVLAAGGNCVNTAIGLARQGVAVGIAASIGGNRFGQFVRERVSAEGIDDLSVIPEAKTSTSIVLVQGSGERH